MSSESVIVELEPEDGRYVPMELSSRMRRQCHALSTIPQGAVLRDVQVKPFRTVMGYLNGEESLSIFTDRIESKAFLLLFAQTWVLAARLGLPLLQNDLMTIMISLHTHIMDGRSTCSKFPYTTDESLLKAFQHLRDQIGRNTHAENFLICFAGRTAPRIAELEQNLNSWRMDRDIRKEILTEARSFDPDSSKHHPEAFLINPDKPPMYPPLEILKNKTDLVSGSWMLSDTTSPIIVDMEDTPQTSTIYGGSGNDR